jgi:hypothetical protein
MYVGMLLLLQVVRESVSEMKIKLTYGYRHRPSRWLLHTRSADSPDPNAIVPAPNGPIDFKALNYTELILIPIKPIQEQQQQIDALKRTIEESGGRPKP